MPWSAENPNQPSPSHAFAVIGYDPNLNAAAGGTLTIRNPWGQDNVPFPNVQNNPIQQNNLRGTFTMTLAQFTATFGTISIER